MGKPESWRAWEGQLVEGKFSLLQLLGGTEHSAVFLTELPDQKSQKVAIKLIELQGEDSVQRVAQLRTAAKLSHPHLIRIFEAGRCVVEGTPLIYAVTEYAEEDLSQILPQRALSQSEVSELLPPLLDAVSYLHGLGFVHGRIKPSNVLAVGDQLKLSSDQVAAQSAEPSETRRRRDVFDAPESAAGIFTPASDVWSVGVTLVAAITQNVTIAEDTSVGSPTLPETIPEPYRGIVRECLRLDPKRRSSLEQIRARLQPPARSVPQREPLPVPPRSINRRPWLAVALVLLVAVLVGLGVFLSRGKNTSAQNSDATPQPATQATLPASPVREPVAAPKNESTAASDGAVTHQVLPEISESSRNTITGTIKVAVRVEVDSSGKVKAAKLKTAGPSRYFAGKALAAAQRWDFAPPTKDGQPTTSAWLLQFRFRRSSIQASSQRLAR